MRCPRCSYKLTESDWLLCNVPRGHYCPHCWAEISDEGELMHAAKGASQQREDTVLKKPVDPEVP